MTCFSRAQTLLGTLVSITVHRMPHEAQANLAMKQAFEAMAHVGQVMSAHDPESDLGRISRSRSGAILTLDPQTVHVLRCAQRWVRLSQGAYDPVRAATQLCREHRRPGLVSLSSHGQHLHELTIVSDSVVHLLRPLAIDLGGIAKGYAVDLACQVLKQHGVTHAVVNAGGDLRMLGRAQTPIFIRHAGRGLRDADMGQLLPRHGLACATSAGLHQDSDFVRTRGHRRQCGQGVTVVAHDAITADVLTKWALQSHPQCPRLQRILKRHGAYLWSCT